MTTVDTPKASKPVKALRLEKVEEELCMVFLSCLLCLSKLLLWPSCNRTTLCVAGTRALGALPVSQEGDKERDETRENERSTTMSQVWNRTEEMHEMREMLLGKSSELRDRRRQ